MSRSCYSDDYGDEFPGQLGLYRGNMDRSRTPARGRWTVGRWCRCGNPVAFRRSNALPLCAACRQLHEQKLWRQRWKRKQLRKRQEPVQTDRDARLVELRLARLDAERRLTRWAA